MLMCLPFFGVTYVFILMLKETPFISRRVVTTARQHFGTVCGIMCFSVVPHLRILHMSPY